MCEIIRNSMTAPMGWIHHQQVWCSGAFRRGLTQWQRGTTAAKLLGKKFNALSWERLTSEKQLAPTPDKSGCLSKITTRSDWVMPEPNSYSTSQTPRASVSVLNVDDGAIRWEQNKRVCLEGLQRDGLFCLKFMARLLKQCPNETGETRFGVVAQP